ncbi:MAG: O-antigen ligase family protein, partial [Ignavibacteria bacterium]|nr:O-antigen ligase family protein [Ignavibacteria bacterium]
FSQRINAIKSFSIAYIFTTMVGGFVLLIYIITNYPGFIINPLIDYYGIGRLPIINYHSFSYPYAISIIMLIALVLLTKRIIVRFTCICAVVYCLYFLYFGHSRQSIIAAVIVYIFYQCWHFSTKYFGIKGLKYNTKSGLLLIMVVIASTAYIFFESSPLTFLRDTQTVGLVENVYSVSVEESRWNIWQTSIQTILDSYFLGTVYEAGNVHNIILSVLANEGIIGFILMLGFFIFFIKQIRNVWAVKEISTIAIWRMTYFCIFLFTIIHSQFSGDNISAPELFWSVIFLWYSNKYSNVMQSEANRVLKNSHNIPGL